MPKLKKKESLKKKPVVSHREEGTVSHGEEKVVVEELSGPTPVEALELMIRPAYDKARSDGSHAVGIFHREFGDRIKQWKDLTGKRFPEEF